jgi:hypothetical protein
MLVEMLRISGVGRLVCVVSSMFLSNSILFLMLRLCPLALFFSAALDLQFEFLLAAVPTNCF